MLAGPVTEAVHALQGKKEKKRREKKKEKEMIPIGAPAEEEPKVSTFFEELEREVRQILWPYCHRMAIQAGLSRRDKSCTATPAA